MIKKIIIATWVFIASSVFSSSAEDNYNYKFDPGYPVDENHMMGAYNAPARIDVKNSWDFYVNGTFILWQPKQQGLDLALISPIFDRNANHASILNTDFDYDPGFKLSLGTGYGSDNWQSWAEYTRLYTKNRARRSVAHTHTTITNYWRIGTALSNLINISSNWFSHFNILDLSIGRPYYVGTKLIFNPYFGGKAGWIDQKYNVIYTNIVQNVHHNYVTKVKSKSWLLGPRIGVNTNWLLGEGFRFFGNAAASIFYQSFKLYAKEYEDVDPITLSTNAREKQGFFNTALEFALGFGWGTYFSNNKWHVDIIAGYELDLYWNQNMMRSFIEELKNQISSKAGNLTPHGFIVTLQFDF